MARLGDRTKIWSFVDLGRGVAPALALVLGVGAPLSGCGEEKAAPIKQDAGDVGDAGPGNTAGDGGQAGGAYRCGKTAKGATRGSAIALSQDDSRLVSVNRDLGTVTVMSVAYGADELPTITVVTELSVGAEPWQVAIDACGTRAYVVLRKDQQVVVIEDLNTTPKVGKKVAVGSEPTSLALTPNNTKLYVSNWVDGTLSVIDTAALTVSGTVDLNQTIAASGALGQVEARPALAHPRGIAITNDEDDSDSDETVYATEWFALRTAPETIATADTNWKGYLYKVNVGKTDASAIDLPPVLDTGFIDAKGEVTGCFPNQVGSVTLEGGFAYVTSTCASPKGPTGVFTGTIAETDPTCEASKGTHVKCGVAEAGGNGACDVATNKCLPNPITAKTTTHPGLTIVKLADGTATTTVLDKKFQDKKSPRMPLLPTDLGFFNGFAYLTSYGADGVFRVSVTDGKITDVGASSKVFIDMRNPAAPTVRLPMGIATNHGAKAFAFVANDGTRDVNAVDFNTQSIAGQSATDLRITAAADLPVAGSDEEHVLNGKRFFNTGLGRWSLAGAAFGSCASCHIDGLTDNVTWYFARGPRQSVSLDGSFDSKDKNNQRIFNWTAIFDEVSDFEGNTRGISGGLGALVHTVSMPPAVTDRIDTAGGACDPLPPAACALPPQQGLQGSSTNIATPGPGTDGHAHSVLRDFLDITAWMQTVRSPRKAANLAAEDIEAGREIFQSSAQGNCVGCHSGPKWTISTKFYESNDSANAATASTDPKSLGVQDWFTGKNLNGFPPALFPVTTPAGTNTRFRFGAAPAAEQIQCILRPVGTFGVSNVDEVNVLELRTDMATVAQGAAADGRGYNPPSLLGMQVGGPYFHAGNARSLEEVFDARFVGHHQSAIANVFNPNPEQVRQLVAYLLSIDEDETPMALPMLGSSGGDLCLSFVP